MKNNVAFWTDSPPNSSDLHINYWVIKKRLLLRDHFLDFGLKLNDWTGGKVHFFIPIKKINKSIFDIGSELSERKLANALFNENCEIISKTDKRIEITLPKEQLTVFVIDIKNDIQVQSLYDGTLFSINLPLENRNWYIRFRIRIGFSQALLNFISSMEWQTIRSVFSEKDTPNGSFYQSVRNSIEAIDFRVNNKRSLNVSLLDENQDKFIKFRKLHFLLISESDEDLNFSSTKLKKIHLLEKEVWKKYLQGASKSYKNYCAYHWSCTPEVGEGWVIFLKLQFGSANILTIAMYLFVICFIGAIVNIASAFLYENREKIGFYHDTNLAVKSDCIQSLKDVTGRYLSYIETIGCLGYAYSYSDFPLEFDEIEKHLRKIMEITPEDGHVIGSLGWIYYKKGLYTEAINFLKKAALLEPSVSIIYERLGDAYQKNNQETFALEAYEQALSSLKKIEDVKSNTIAKKIEKLKKSNR